MTTEGIAKDIVNLEGAPDIPELTFRRFRGEPDYANILAVYNGCKAADGLQETITLEEFANFYRHMPNFDPYRDMLFAEADARVIGYNRVYWRRLDVGELIYRISGQLLPAWRGRGIGRAMLRHAERRARQVARENGHDGETPGFYQAWTADTETSFVALLESEGYRPERYFIEMQRPLDEPIPQAPMPEGLEVRPARREHYRAIWEANVEAFRDHWGANPATEEDYQRFLEEPTLNPALWQVAWDGDQVAGMVLNFVKEEENREFGRRRGYTEDICVRRPWRRRGLARALLVRSMRMFKEMGMEETALGVDVENPKGALRLYESAGYRPAKQYVVYRKPVK